MRVVLALVVGSLYGAVAVDAQQASYYVLDGFGGVHAGGDAPAITPSTPYFGFDIARDLAYVAVGKRIGAVDVVGDGLQVLDGFGGIHVGGALPRSMATPVTPYFGFDVARAITYRNVAPRAAGTSRRDQLEILASTGTPSPVLTSTIRAPDDGFLLVTAAVTVSCRGSTAVIFDVVELGLALDSTTRDATARVDQTFASAAGGGGCNEWQNATLVRTFPVSAGAHFVHLLAGQIAANRVYVHYRALQLLFIDQDDMGGS